MSIDIATIVKVSSGLEYMTCLYVTSENNFKFIDVIYDADILKSYEVCVRCSNSRSVWFIAQKS
jgi:hypothetical protein